jgi:hypothetical protein
VTRIEQRITNRNISRIKLEGSQKLQRGYLEAASEISSNGWGVISLVDLGETAAGGGGEEDLTADARLGLHRPCSAPRFPCCFVICVVAEAKEKHPCRTRKGRYVVLRVGVVLLDRAVSNVFLGGVSNVIREESDSL